MAIARTDNQAMNSNEAIKKQLAANIARLMDERGIKAQALAKTSGAGFRSLYRVIRAEGNPTLDLLTSTAEGLRVPVWALLLEQPLSAVDARGLAALVKQFHALSPANRELAVNMISALSGDNTLAAPKPSDKDRNTAA